MHPNHRLLGTYGKIAFAMLAIGIVQYRCLAAVRPELAYSWTVAHDATNVDFGAMLRDLSPEQFGKLRSAYLLRGAVCYPDTATSNVDQLRAHFGVVLQILARHTESSLAIALERLESQRSIPFSSDERADWYSRLLQRRTKQLAVLQAYQQRGVFPQNHSHQLTPIFVDDADTACAVGHLMRESGAHELTASVHQLNNLVYVTEVSAGPVNDWILQSGLTQEEAALIQPTYQDELPLDYLGLIYDPSDGQLFVSTGDRGLTTLEIKSRSGAFVGTRPPQADGVFDVFTRNKLFILKTGGFGQNGVIDFGHVAQSGIAYDAFVHDFSVDGSFFPRGRVAGWCIDNACFPVPEPNTNLTLGVGVIGALTMARRRVWIMA